MRLAEVKQCLADCLPLHLDPLLFDHGFVRRPKEVRFVRKTEACIQELSVFCDILSSDDGSPEVRLSPNFILKMPEVSSVAMQMVDNDRNLLASAEDVVLNNPVQWCAPKPHQTSWYARDLAEVEMRLSDIGRFLDDWFLDFVDEITEPERLLLLFERGDDRLVTQQHTMLFLAAAAYIVGGKERALAFLNENFESRFMRSRYRSAFKFVGG